jgi:hypothetical protein
MELRHSYKIGQRVICNGYPGAVREFYSEGMVVVQLSRGQVCVDHTDLKPMKAERA